MALLQRLVREYDALNKESQDSGWFSVSYDRGSKFTWILTFQGPKHWTVNPCGGDGPRASPYGGGTFLVRVHFTSAWPSAPPGTKDIQFVNTVYHPGVDEEGRFCTEFLRQMWTPKSGVKQLLHLLRGFLANPQSVGSPLNAAAHTLLKDSVEGFEKHVLGVIASQEDSDSDGEDGDDWDDWDD